MGAYFLAKMGVSVSTLLFNLPCLSNLNKPAPDATMASSGSKTRTPRGSSTLPSISMSDLTTRISQLELENKHLKRRLKKENVDQGENSPRRGGGILTSQQKEIMTAAAVAKLTAMAQKKIEMKVRNELAAAVSRDEVEKVLQSLNMRVSLSFSESAQGGRSSQGSAIKRTLSYANDD